MTLNEVPKPIIGRKLEHELEKRMIFDKLLEESELTEEDVDIIDHKVKKGIMELLL